MELHLIRTFVAVAETGGVTRAAERLHQTQPTVSGHLKTLEGRVGVALFVRGARGMQLTTAGQELLPSARRFVEQADAIERLAKNLKRGLAGSLRVGLNNAPFWFQPGPLWSRLSASYPDLTLSFDQGPSGQLMQWLRDGQLDVAFIEGAAHASIETRPLTDVDVVLTVPPAWADELADRPSRDQLRLLHGRPWVFTSPQCSYHRLFETLWRDLGPPSDRRYQVDHSLPDMIDLVQQGLAASLMERRTAEAAAAEGRVAICDAFEATIPMSVAVLRSRRDEPVVAAFLESCAAMRGEIVAALRPDPATPSA